MSKFRTYLVSYNSQGAQGSLELKATSMADAKARLGRLAFGNVDGELMATVPAFAGLFVRLLTAARNWLVGPRGSKSSDLHIRQLGGHLQG